MYTNVIIQAAKPSVRFTRMREAINTHQKRRTISHLNYSVYISLSPPCTLHIWLSTLFISFSLPNLSVFFAFYLSIFFSFLLASGIYLLIWASAFFSTSQKISNLDLEVLDFFFHCKFSWFLYIFIWLLF